jgi:hypothetical protein
MQRSLTAAAVFAALVACGQMESPVAPTETVADVAPREGTTNNGGAIYTGRGTAVDATIGANNSKLCDAGPLPREGGRIETSSANASLANLLTASKVYCITTSGFNKGISEGTVWNLDLSIDGNRIVADWVHSMAGARCPPNSPAPAHSGSSFVTNLRINGRSITVVRNVPNQRFELRNGVLIFNGHTSFITPWHAGRTVTGLRILTNGANGRSEILIARSQTHIDCP